MKNAITLLKVKSYELMLQQLKASNSNEFETKQAKTNKMLTEAAKSGLIEADAADFISKSYLLKMNIELPKRTKKTSTNKVDKANLTSDAWTPAQIKAMYENAIANGTLI